MMPACRAEITHTNQVFFPQSIQVVAPVPSRLPFLFPDNRHDDTRIGAAAVTAVCNWFASTWDIRKTLLVQFLSRVLLRGLPVGYKTCKLGYNKIGEAETLLNEGLVQRFHQC